MDIIEHPIHVNWRHRVAFTDHVLAPDNRTLRNLLAEDAAVGARKALVVLDAGLAGAQPTLPRSVKEYFAAHADALALAGEPMVCDGGESAKSAWSRVEEILTAVDRHHIDRHSYLITIGGGALLDMTGFAAAIAHRGVRHVRIPTTTLSQCDSGVGVKNGINAFGKKNFIGTYVPPFAVINDFQWLASLPARDKRAGFVEAVKVACIRDAEFFSAIEREAGKLRDFEPKAMRWVIRRCAELHLRHIATGGDPFENGSARPLDFGHWAAHKIEQLSGFRIKHGEAVAIGIALDVIYSRRAGFLSESSAGRVLRLLEALGFELFDGELRRGELLGGLEEFREHLGGKLAITLLNEVGVGVEVNEMNASLVRDAIEELSAHQK